MNIALTPDLLLVLGAPVFLMVLFAVLCATNRDVDKSVIGFTVIAGVYFALILYFHAVNLGSFS